MSLKSRLREHRRSQLLQVPFIKAATTRTGKHALGRIHITPADKRIPKRLATKAGA